MYKYEMDPTRTVGATERTWDVGRTDGRTDRRSDGRTDGRTDRRADRVKLIYPPKTSLCEGYKNLSVDNLIYHFIHLTTYQFINLFTHLLDYIIISELLT